MGPMQRQPAPGERLGFFVVAGNVRGVDDVVSVRERSNVVVVAFPTSTGRCSPASTATRDGRSDRSLNVDWRLRVQRGRLIRYNRADS
jgi:hypothetical protein